MTSLIGAGLGARRRAQQGFGAVAQLEAQENRQLDMLDAAREQQQMSNLGTGAGFGAMYGLNELAAAKAAAGAGTGAGAAGAGAAGAGAAGAGAGATVATLAMPIAIGLGAAFLINKLFD